MKWTTREIMQLVLCGALVITGILMAAIYFAEYIVTR